MINRNNKKRGLFLIFTIIFILGFFSINTDSPIGLAVYDFVNEDLTENESLIVGELVESNITEENITEETFNETLINETNVTEILQNQTNITESNLTQENITLTNLTETNLTLINQTNITELNLTNISLDNLTNVTLGNITNLTLENITINNITQINATFNSSLLNQTNLTVIEERPLHQVIIKQPVRWIKKILPNETNVTIDLPFNANNITVRKILDGKETEVDFEDIIEEPTNLNAITGAFILDFGEGILSKLFNTVSITGLTIYSFVNEEFNQTSSNQTVQNITSNETVEEEPKLEESKKVEKANKTNKIKEESKDEEGKTKKIKISEEADELDIEYTLPGPGAIEENLSYGKRITIFSETNYTNILAYMSIKESLPGSVKLYHITNGSKKIVNATFKDTNNNSLIDHIEWIVPHLSNQTYEAIIEISNAIHLDSNKDFISNIYNEVKNKDNIWSEPIYENEYLRITFEKNLTSSRDITVYVRNNESLNTSIEVYYYNSTESFVKFPIITEEKYYKVFLTNMTGLHKEFDLKIVNKDLDVGYLEFDYIVDPVPTHSTPILNSTFGTNLTSDNLTVYNQSTSDADGEDITNIIDWRLDGTSIALLNMPFETNRTGQSGSVIRDYSLNVNNGTLDGPVWNNTGILGGAYHFDGINDLIDLGRPTSLDLTNAFTLEAWVYANSEPAGAGVITEAFAGDNIVQYEMGFGFNEGGGEAPLY